MSTLSSMARDIGVKALVEAIRAILRSITDDPEEQKKIFDESIERARERVDAAAELAASKRRRGVT